MATNSTSKSARKVERRAAKQPGIATGLTSTNVSDKKVAKKSRNSSKRESALRPPPARNEPVEDHASARVAGAAFIVLLFLGAGSVGAYPISPTPQPTASASPTPLPSGNTLPFDSNLVVVLDAAI